MTRHYLLTAGVVPALEWPHRENRRGLIFRLRRLWLDICPGHGFRSLRRPPYEEVSPGLLQGRCLTGKQAAWALGDGVTAVVDLAAGFPAPALLRDLPYLDLRLLPGTGPSAAQLRLALAFIRRHRSRGKVLILCADRGVGVRDIIAAYPRVPQKYRSDDSM